MIILYKKLQYINKQLHNIIHSGSIPKQLQQKLNITQNIMKQQISAKPLPYSLLTSMYLAWQEYKVPAVYYHYLLSVLPNMQKKQQMLLMINQVKSLKANNHSYHRIVNAIQARERSLQIIKSNIEVFIQYQSTNAMDWPQKNNSSNHIQLQFDNDAAQPPSPYRVTHEDPRNPILSPSLSQSLSSKSARLQQLLNHIRMYQRMTAQIIIMISQWQNQLKQLGYNDSVVQFQFHKQDYIQRINNDTLDLLDRYQSIFENNCFFIIKKIHQKSQYALIYKELKFSKQMLEKVNSCLNIIANHEADILRFRMLSKVGQAANRRRKIIKSTDISKIYMNYNNGSDYLIVQDTETMKKSKILHQPILNRNKNLIHDAQIQQLNSALAQNAKLKSLKNSIIINPEARLMTIDKTARKHPVQSSLLNLLTSSNSDLKAKAQQVYLKNPQNLQMSPMTRKNNRTQQIKTQIKRSTTLDQSLMKRRNTMDINLQQNIKNTFQFKTNMSQAKFRERVEVKPIHGQNSIFVRDRDNNNREDQLQKNKGLSVQRKLEAVQKINLELKLKNKSYAERKQQQKNNIKNQPAFDDEDILKSQRSIQPQVMVPKQVPGELSQQSDLIFNFQQNIKSTEIVKYLRTKVFNNSPEVGFQQIQALAKKLLADKNYITFIRITSGQLIVAWLAVKFVQKDNTMRRSVHIVYVRKFVRMSGFQRKLLDGFVTNGYGLIRNQERILYQVELLDVVLRPLLKIKYKLSPSCQKAQLKKIMSKNATIAKCRLLKYHSYSKQTKYHRYCQHNKSFCMISYNFLQISRICVNNLKYIQAKADKIIKLGEGLYRVSCIVNQTDLVISNTMMDLIGLEQQSPIQRDSSFEQGMQTKYRYIAVKQNKTMKKYVNQKDQTILCQFITISGNIPEVKSIAFSKEDVKQNVLILEPPYFMAIMTKDVGEAKMLSVIQFS